MNWFLIAILPPIFWSITNHFDKYLLSKYFKASGVGAMMIFSSLIGLILLPIIVFIHPEVLKNFSSIYFLISLNGFLNILAILPYFYALQKDETSTVSSLFQMIPIFTFFLSYFVLNETLNNNQIIGGLIIIIGAILISLDLTIHKKINFKKEVFFLMTLSSFLFSINFLFFKYFAIGANFWITSFWEYIGFVVFAILIFAFIKPYRNQFLMVLKTNKIPVLTINSINEIINIIAKITFNFASLLAPITLIWIVNGLQPFFIFIYGIVLTLFFPKIAKENITKKVLIQKITAIIIMFIGSYLINRS